ncbi:glutamate racemase [Nitrococcus mobilis]|uniref:Glutamate racemase n=1 Tax=Nitrococcus mobilis Nb-231 TaxID=314278 RepID=A4BKY1_9GAMM|nr:glutamate racemase [Nitrococcus mobilis]EAR22969.1 glutamate racemase [Nitrococcus mobilis Nb-231]
MGTACDDPIGIFDSGLGGLSVVHAIRRLLPTEQLLYVADCAHAPYGGCSAAFIRTRALALAGFLQTQRAKALVVACNTATAAAAEALRRQFELPIIAMEPAVKRAAAATRCNVVGVLATEGTLASARFAGLLARFAGAVQVVTRPAPDLVLLVERGEIDGIEAMRRVEAHVSYLLHQGSDTIVLGCTHYPHLRPLIERAAGPEIAIIDTGPAVARELRRRLEEKDLVRSSAGGGLIRIWTSATTSSARAIAQRLAGPDHSALVIDALPALPTSQSDPGRQATGG